MSELHLPMANKTAFTFKFLRHWNLSRRKYSTELFKIQLRRSISENVHFWNS